MTDQLVNIIRGQKLLEATGRLSLVKFCTTGSIAGRHPKIIFFVFREGDKTPSLVAKSVRSAAANFVIERGYAGLVRLGRLAADVGMPQLFAKPLWSGNLGDAAASIEEAVAGRRARGADVPAIVSAYCRFESGIAATEKKSVPAADYARRLLEGSGLPDTDRARLSEYSLRFFAPHDQVVLMLQHGDLTLDNVFMSDQGVRFIDCDNLARIELAGFDLFHLFSRASPNESYDSLAPRMAEYWRAIGERTWNRNIAWLYYLHELLSKDAPLSRAGAERIIAAFEKRRAGWHNASLK